MTTTNGDPSADEKDEKAVRMALDRSGFPFQARVASTIKLTPRWSLEKSEMAWETSKGEGKFLDIVARKDHGLFAAIECKKTNKERLTFLRPIELGGADETASARIPVVVQIRDSTRRLEPRWASTELAPISFESQICVVSTDAEGKNERLLEKDAGTLVHAARAVALRYVRENDYRARQSESVLAPVVVVPILVTNAKLFTTRFESRTVSLETGAFDAEALISPVKFIRFRKSFVTSHPDPGDVSIFVVQSAALGTFLEQIEAIDGEFEMKNQTSARPT